MADEAKEPDTLPASGKKERREFWQNFGVIYLAGVIAATGIGKTTPITVELRADLSLSLSQTGLVASLVTAVAATLGLFVSYLLKPFDPRRTLVAGLVVMGCAGLFCAQAGSFAAMLGGRLVESVGYVIVVIVAPVLVFGLGTGNRLTGALALWGTFMPVGLAFGAFGGGVVSAWLGWRTWLSVAAVITLAVAAAALLRLPPGAARPAEATADRGRPGAPEAWPRRLARPLALGAGFSTISGAIVACVALYPAYLHEEFGVPTAAAGTLTGMVSFVGVASGFLASVLLRRGKKVKHLFLVTLLIPAAAFAAFGGAGDTGLSVSAALVVALANEFVVATVFAAIPLVVRVGSDIGTANGLVAQFGSIGALAGPPLVGLAVTATDWWAVGPSLLGGCGTGLVLLLLAARGARGCVPEAVTVDVALEDPKESA
ncbi:MFS transporter [Streptomyces carminius]|nr:MFS transporter [Streptomyces carminius]